MILSDRDKLVAMVVPALGTFIIYVWVTFNGWFSRYLPNHRAYKQAVAALATAQQKAPEEENKFLMRQAEVMIADRDLKRLEAKKAEVRKTWEQACGRCTDAGQRNERIKMLNSVLARHGLRVVEDAEAESGGKDGRVAPTVDKLAKQLAELSAKNNPQLRKVRLKGGYLDVLAALDDLANKEVVAIPVGLAMKEASLTDHDREWILLVWI